MTARSNRRALIARAERAKALSTQADDIMTKLDSVVEELADLLKVVVK